MVDCETLGVIPNKNPVLQIAIVEFNPDTFEPILTNDGKINNFECFLPLADQFKLNRQPDPQTVKWWQSKDKEEVAKVVFDGVNEAKPLVEELQNLSSWIKNICKNNLGNYSESVFWAKPTLFDYPFIDGLFLETKIPSPFHFRKVVDVHSYIIGSLKSAHYVLKHYPMTHEVAYETYWAAFEKVKAKHKGRNDAHNASADCIFQLDWLKEISDNLNHYVSDIGIQSTMIRKD